MYTGPFSSRYTSILPSIIVTCFSVLLYVTKSRYWRLRSENDYDINISNSRHQDTWCIIVTTIFKEESTMDNEFLLILYIYIYLNRLIILKLSSTTYVIRDMWFSQFIWHIFKVCHLHCVIPLCNNNTISLHTALY